MEWELFTFQNLKNKSYPRLDFAVFSCFILSLRNQRICFVSKIKMCRCSRFLIDWNWDTVNRSACLSDADVCWPVQEVLQDWFCGFSCDLRSSAPNQTHESRKAFPSCCMKMWAQLSFSSHCFTPASLLPSSCVSACAWECDSGLLRSKPRTISGLWLTHEPFLLCNLERFSVPIWAALKPLCAEL